MKKSFILILALTLVLTAIFASCGNDGETEKGDDKNPTAYVDGNDNVVDDPFDIEETEAAE